MNDPINQLKQSANDVRMNRAAFERLRAELVAHMGAHPAAVPSPYARFLLLKRPVAALVIIALVGLGGATTYAAHGALPGDPLYPLKVKVIEPVQGLLAVTPEAKAAFQASIASERLAEAAQLAAKEKLTPEEGDKTNERFTRSLDAAQQSIDELAKTNPHAAADIKASLAKSLGEHQSVLSTLGAASSTNGEEARKIAGHAKQEIDSAFEEGSTTPSDRGEDNGKSGNPAGLLDTLQGKHSIRGAIQGEDDGGIELDQ